MRRVLVLGSTGSVGAQALQVVASSLDLVVVGLSCRRSVGLLLEQAMSLGVRELAVEDAEAAATISPALFPELSVRSGPSSASRLVCEVDADLVLNALVGFAGLEPTLAALGEGRSLALANKESLVCAGGLVTRCAGEKGVTILPVDSEHSALFQLLNVADREEVESLVLTASGGPFRGRSRKELESVTVKDALAHPTWTMGEKITVDSATLMNKGLEIIEAHHLFGVPYPDVDVLVHPQSLVHAMVTLRDGAVLAHLGVPDMRMPIAYALHFPQRPGLALSRLDLAAAGRLEFDRPDAATFRGPELARRAGDIGDAATCALNAANEVAVGHFLRGELPFLGIAEVVEDVLDEAGGEAIETYEAAVFVDTWARARAEEHCRAIGTAG